MATVVPWLVPVRANSYRATELRALHVGGGKLTLRLIQEEDETLWELSFGSVQAFRVTSEECASSILEKLPQQGGFFQVQGSTWLIELGQSNARFLEKALHFVVCCYDEIVEIVGTEPSFVRLDSTDLTTAGPS